MTPSETSGTIAVTMTVEAANRAIKALIRGEGLIYDKTETDGRPVVEDDAEWLRWLIGRIQDGLRAAEATEGLPADLARILRDPTITIDKDHEIVLADGRTLFEHIQEWRNAPSNTASAD